jgi:ferredoxin
VERCASGALHLEEVSGEDAETPAYDFTSDFVRPSAEPQKKYRAVPDDAKCVRCGYCTKVCPVFALKVF